MKKAGIAILIIVSLIAAYGLGSVSGSKVIEVPAADWPEGSAAAQAWREFAVSMEAAGAAVFAHTTDTSERLEGLNFIAQLASASLEMKLAKGSVTHPQFTDWMGDHRKFLGDSPDAIYHTAQLSSNYRYEITGNRGDAGYLGFMLYGQQINGWNRAASNASSENLRFNEAGDFTIVISQQPPADESVNWLEMETDIHMVMVRQYYHGRQGKRAANLSIRNLDNPAHEPDNDATIAEGLGAATTFFNDTLSGAIALTSMLAESPNRFDPPSSYSAEFGGVFYPTLDNEYFGGWFYLEDDEALIIEGAIPNAPYWALSLQNRWMQSMDYENHQVALNDRQITTQNGRYRVVLAHQKPPPGNNWLSTAGKREGLLSIRYQLSEDSEKPTLRRVKFDELEND